MTAGVEVYTLEPCGTVLAVASVASCSVRGCVAADLLDIEA